MKQICSLTVAAIALSLISEAVAGGNIKIYSVSKAKVVKGETSNPKISFYTAEPAPAPAPKLADEMPVYQEINVEEEQQQELPPSPVPTAVKTFPSAIPIKAPVTDVTYNDLSERYNSVPQYNFAYQVHDGISGNNHGHSEVRSGDSVQGQYSVLHPDGILRTVHYTSDSVNGYNAIVDKQPQHVNFIKQASPIVQTPIQYQYTQPAAFSAQPPIYAPTYFPTAAASAKLRFSFSSPGSAYTYSV